MTRRIVHQLAEARPVRVQPTPLRGAADEPAPYPLDALGDRLARAARAIMHRVQVPDALAAHSVLSAAALAVQGHVLVQMPTGQRRPASLFLATIADSGERKTSADQLALAPIVAFERELDRQHGAATIEHQMRAAAWKTERDALGKRAGQDEAAIAAGLSAIGDPPAPPPLPVIVVPPGSTQGVISVLEKGRPSIGLFINEGASWLGSWGMQDEQRTASIAAYSELWDGQTVKTLTKGDGFRSLSDRAFGFHVMVQRHYMERLFGDAEMREQGFLSRILTAAPASLAGTRLRDLDAAEPASVAVDLADYHDHLARIIRAPLPVDPVRPNGLEHRRQAVLDADAVRLFWTFYNHVERQQGEGGDLADVRGFAGKATEQVARLATIIHVFEHGLRDLSIDAADVSAAIELMNFYLGEAQRLAHTAPVDPELDAAEALSSWLAETHGGGRIGLRAIQQRAPSAVRKLRGAGIRRLCAILVENDHLTPIDGGAVIDGDRCRDAWRVNVGG